MFLHGLAWGPSQFWGPLKILKNGFHWTSVRNQSFCQRNEINGERIEILDAVTADPKTSWQCVPYFTIQKRNRKSCRGEMVRAESSRKTQKDFFLQGTPHPLETSARLSQRRQRAEMLRG